MNYKKLVAVGVGLFLLAIGVSNFAPFVPQTHADTPSSFTWQDASTIRDANGVDYTFKKSVQGGVQGQARGGGITLYEAIFIAETGASGCTVATNNSQTDGAYTYKYSDLNYSGASAVIIQTNSAKYAPGDATPTGQAAYIEFNAPTGGGDNGCQASQAAHVSIGNTTAASTIFNWVDAGTITSNGSDNNGWIYKNTDSTKPNTFYKTPPNSGVCSSYIVVDASNTSGEYWAALQDPGGQTGYKKVGNCWIKDKGKQAIGQLANASIPAGSGVNSNPTGQSGADTELDCGSATLNWLVCPVITLAQGAAEKLDGLIASALTTNVSTTFGTPYYTAWNSFRVLATGILVIAGLIMVASQALGFEFLDAYTIRKVLPRLLIAVIGLSLSWPLMKFVVGFFNTFGNDVYGLIVGPFTTIKASINPGIGALTTVLAPIAGVAALFIFGPSALLIIVSGLLGLLMAFLILLVRQIGITAIVILAPIALACYILPNTQKVWKIWLDNFLGLMLMFPIVMAFIAAGHAFALVSEQSGGSVSQMIGIIAYFIPYFLLPLAFRLATGAISTISGMVNDRSKGVFDRMKGIRQKAAEENMAAYKQGFKRTKLGSRLEAGKHERIARREAWGSGAIGIGKRGSARYRTSLENTEFGHMARAAAESIKNNPAAAANDDANKVAQVATSRDDFIRRMMINGASRDSAMSQLTYTEQAFGDVMGSKQMQHTAATAALASNSSTDSVAERAAWMRNAVANHVMTDSQSAALVKQSGSLASSAGFGDLLGAANGTLSDAGLLARASDGFNAANSHRMRKGQAQELAKHMLSRADEAARAHGVGSDEFATAVANAAGVHDVMNGMTPDVREEFAKHLNGAAVAGKYIREHESVMEATGNGAYLDRRKTWAASAAAAGAAGGGAPGGAGGGGAGGGAPGGAGAGAPPSDRRLKRDIRPLAQTANGIQLYSFRYLWSNQEYVGVMAQDLAQSHPEALFTDELGFYRVDYAKLGLRMMTIEEWEAAKTSVQSVSKS